jgi:hypothetical protein
MYEGLAVNWRRGSLRLLIVFEGVLLACAGAWWALLHVPDPPRVVPPHITLMLVGGLFALPSLVLAAMAYGITWAVRGFLVTRA